MHTCIHAYINTYTNTSVHTYIHTYINILYYGSEEFNLYIHMTPEVAQCPRETTDISVKP